MNTEDEADRLSDGMQSFFFFSSRCSGLILVRVGAGVVVGVLLALPAHFPCANGHVMAMQQLEKREQRHQSKAMIYEWQAIIDYLCQFSRGF